MEALALTVMADVSDSEHRLVVALSLAEANISAAVYQQSLLPGVDFLRVVFKTSRADVLTRYVAVTSEGREVMTDHPERFNAKFGLQIRAENLREWSLLYLEVCRSMAHRSGFFYPDSAVAASLPGVELLFGVDTPMGGVERARVMRWASQIEGDEYLALVHIFRTFARADSWECLLRQLPAAMLSDLERRQVRAYLESKRKVPKDWLIQWWGDASPMNSIRERAVVIGRCERLVPTLDQSRAPGIPTRIDSPQGRYALLIPYCAERTQPDIAQADLWRHHATGFVPRGESLPYRGRNYFLPEAVSLCDQTYVIEVDPEGGILATWRWEPTLEDFAEKLEPPVALAQSLAIEADSNSLFLPWLEQPAAFHNPIVGKSTFRGLLYFGNALCAVELKCTGAGFIEDRAFFGTP